MIAVWLFALRAATAASYATLGLADPSAAGDIAWPVGLLAFLVAINDLRVMRRRR